MSLLKFGMKSMKKDESGKVRKVILNALETERTVDTTDLPIILNALTGFTPDQEKNNGFIYTFPITLS